jgi:hypothetical protein
MLRSGITNSVSQSFWILKARALPQATLKRTFSQHPKKSYFEEGCFGSALSGTATSTASIVDFQPLFGLTLKISASRNFWQRTTQLRNNFYSSGDCTDG